MTIIQREGESFFKFHVKSKEHDSSEKINNSVFIACLFMVEWFMVCGGSEIGKEKPLKIKFTLVLGSFLFNCVERKGSDLRR